MKKPLIIFLVLFCSAAWAQNDVNYDESKVPAYTLPDVLTCNDDSKVTTVKKWEKQRRPEIMEMFSSLMYGRTPEDKINVKYEVLSENKNDLHGKATSRQVRFVFSSDSKSTEAILLLFLPNSVKAKVPVFVAYNFKGNHSTNFDTAVFYSPSLYFVKEPGHPDWKRGCQSSRWCFERIIDRGYAVATMCYHDIFPDKPGLKDHSIVSLFPAYGKEAEKSDEWQAIGAWAWGSSRIADYLKTENRIDPLKFIVVGHSRQGKAALWAGAQDTRFKVVISNDSGSGGAALSKREFGETVARVASITPRWFCVNFDQYKNNEENLPFDQHELIALIAPRKAYIASALEDTWADPKGEYLSGYYAGPVYKLYGLTGFETDVQPAVHQPILNDIGYHVRAGKHDVTDYDWDRFMDFSDKHLSEK